MHPTCIPFNDADAKIRPYILFHAAVILFSLNLHLEPSKKQAASVYTHRLRAALCVEPQITGVYFKNLCASCTASVL
jgi:hypothetical protein